ncbi:hypothetical protein MTR_8g021010 [Medicago truncatula]|uniref:Uncharacterized protein n=1 Tax=Medicago truncatula TaxID=3880 RepID=G7L7K1_MEDTR|nr:hypothetical protein MTR_8g021010 [Medicago truncatula]
MVVKQQQSQKQICNTGISQRPANEKPSTTTRKRTNQPNLSPPKAPTTLQKVRNGSDDLREGGFRLKGEQNHTKGRSWRGGGPTTPPSGHESFEEQLSTSTTLRTGTLQTRPKDTHRNYDGEAMTAQVQENADGRRGKKNKLTSVDDKNNEQINSSV